MSSYEYRDRHNQSTEKPAVLGTLRKCSRSFTTLLKTLSLMVTGGVVLTGLIVGYGTWRTGDRFLSKLTTAFTAPQPEAKVDVRSIVVQQVRGASELTTAIFAMEAVVPASRDRTFGGYVIGKTTLLYIAYGEIRAGVDLSALQPQDVEVVEDTIRLRLPPPRILDSKIDVNRSTVYDYDRGFLGLGPDVAPELQSLAQQETLREILQTACSQGLLQDASDRAKAVVTQLLTTAGYKNFSVDIQPSATDACTPASDINPPANPSPNT